MYYCTSGWIDFIYYPFFMPFKNLQQHRQQDQDWLTVPHKMKDLNAYTDVTRNFAIIGVVVWSPGARDGQVA